LSGVAVAQNEEVSYSIPGKTARVGTRTVQVGPTRIIAREARTPQVASWSDGTMVMTAGNPVVSTNIRSSDQGQRWMPQTQYFGYVNSLEVQTGNLLIVNFDLEIINTTTGSYKVDRWISQDKGMSLLGPITNGRVTLPPAQFDTGFPHWINEFIQMPNGDMFAAVQSLSPNATSFNDPWDTALIESVDGGIIWSFKSMVANQSTISDPGGKLTANNWPLYYATEPTLLHTGGNNLVCVMRSTNDEMNNMPLTQISAPSSTYHDLGSTISGDGIFSGIMSLPANQYYQPGPPNAPLIIAHSSDRGATWTAATPMARARGVFPRLAKDGNGIVALCYGGLSGVPRWGHAIVFSFDGGLSWTREVQFGPFLTTGYTDIVAVGPGHFVVFYDVTPPQPWTNHEHWWTGAVDIEVFDMVQVPPAEKTAR